VRRFAASTALFFLLLPGIAAAADVTMVFGGDVMLGRAVRDQIVKVGKNDGTWATSKVAEVFRNAQLAFVNLESPFAPGAALGYSLVFRADPAHITALTRAGIDVVSFANNHSRNQGVLGIQTTLSLLKKNSIAPAGAGLSSSEAYAPRYLRAGEQPVAVLAYTYNEKAPTSPRSKPTIAGMDIGRMQSAVKAAKATGAFVIVSMHAGTEYTLTRTSQQTRFAHAAIDAGADLIVGAHPHWAQTLEKYRGKPILYSLGNLVFDQPWSVETQQGAVAVVTVRDGKVAQVQLKIVKIDRAAQPRWMTPAEAAPVLKRIGLPSGTVRF
jgi:poly-gamma-glutamate capsule biosynthesis protein CapA/YwtB (metallophosphatase superfamily)